MRAAIFIDGGYLLKQLQDAKVNPDYTRLAEFLLKPLRRNTQLDLMRCYFYYCPPWMSEKPTEAELRRMAAHERFMAEIQEGCDRWQVRLGKLERRREGDKEVFAQKRVDVQLSVDLVQHTAAGHIQHAVLVAGDSDFIPAIVAAKESGTTLTLWCDRDRSVHRDLLKLADEVHYIRWRDFPAKPLAERSEQQVEGRHEQAPRSGQQRSGGRGDGRSGGRGNGRSDQRPDGSLGPRPSQRPDGTDEAPLDNRSPQLPVVASAQQGERDAEHEATLINHAAAGGHSTDPVHRSDAGGDAAGADRQHSRASANAAGADRQRSHAADAAGTRPTDADDGSHAEAGAAGTRPTDADDRSHAEAGAAGADRSSRSGQEAAGVEKRGPRRQAKPVLEPLPTEAGAEPAKKKRSRRRGKGAKAEEPAAVSDAPTPPAEVGTLHEIPTPTQRKTPPRPPRAPRAAAAAPTNPEPLEEPGDNIGNRRPDLGSEDEAPVAAKTGRRRRGGRGRRRKSAGGAPPVG